METYFTCQNMERHTWIKVFLVKYYVSFVLLLSGSHSAAAASVDIIITWCSFVSRINFMSLLFVVFFSFLFL